MRVLSSELRLLPVDRLPCLYTYIIYVYACSIYIHIYVYASIKIVAFCRWPSAMGIHTHIYKCLQKWIHAVYIDVLMHMLLSEMLLPVGRLPSIYVHFMHVFRCSAHVYVYLCKCYHQNSFYCRWAICHVHKYAFNMYIYAVYIYVFMFMISTELLLLPILNHLPYIYIYVPIHIHIYICIYIYMYRSEWGEFALPHIFFERECV